jgi:hypothetical protein
MKLITLNTWGGKLYEPLMEFLKNKSADTDIFCFQEVFPCSSTPTEFVGEVRFDLFSDIKNILTDFNGYHTMAEEDNVGGLAIFIKKSFVVNKLDSVVVFKELNTVPRGHADFFAMGRNLQCLEFDYLGKTYSILNFHGMWNGGGKSDSPKRIEQSTIVRKNFDEAKGSKILCGDFNLNPDTESINILAKGNIDLIKEYKVSSTRSSYYKYPSSFADYVIASSDIEVKDFKALSDEVSDHLPLFVEFD